MEKKLEGFVLYVEIADWKKIDEEDKNGLIRTVGAATSEYVRALSDATGVNVDVQTDWIEKGE